MRKLALIAVLAVPLLGEMRRDIEFSKVGDVSLTLDAWVPEGKGPFPAVIVVHGGGWEAGDKQTYVKPLFEPLTRAGFTWFTINYRLSPQFRFPAHCEDVESALNWVFRHAKEYKVDTGKVALMGESAGGHLVSFAGVQAKIAGVVSFYGVHDLYSVEGRKFALSKKSLRQFLNVEDMSEASVDVMRRASPTTYIRPGAPPFLLIHGSADTSVPLWQSERMCEAMKKAGNRCDLLVVEGGGHGVENWEKEPRFQGYKESMIKWLREVFAGGTEGRK